MSLKVITSAGNESVKFLRKLQSSSKFRVENSLAIADGIHLAESILAVNGNVELFVLSQTGLRNPEIQQIISEMPKGVKKIVLSDSLYNAISKVHASTGISIVFKIPSPGEKKALRGESIVLLDEVQDPGNMGTILRTVASVGIKRIYLSEGSASPWSPKSLRAGMGAQFDLIIYEKSDLVGVIEKVELPVLVTNLNDKSESLYNLDLTKAVSWVFGNEGSGVDKKIIKLATKRIFIPQSGKATESLNVASAVAVCLYEQYRQQL